MTSLSRVVAPVVSLLGVSTNAVLRLLRIQKSDDPPITEEEVGVLLEQGAMAGVFLPAEREMAQRVFELADARVSALMTPRPEVVWIDIEDSEAQIAETISNSNFSRFPVAQGDLDELIGLVDAKELLVTSIQTGHFKIPPIIDMPLVFPETTPALRALEGFRASGEHLAVVIDEYGGTAGVISLQDILEALVGDLPNQGKDAEADAVKRADGSWLLDGTIPADRASDLLGLRNLPGEAEGLFETLGGFVLASLGHIPQKGERFDAEGWSFEVLDMDGRRIDQVLATRIDAAGTISDPIQ